MDIRASNCLYEYMHGKGGGYGKYKNLYQSFKIFREGLVASNHFEEFLKQSYWRYKLPNTPVQPIKSPKEYFELLAEENILFFFEHVEYMDKEAFQLKQEYYQIETAEYYPSFEINILESKGFPEYTKEFDRHHLFLVVEGELSGVLPNEPKKVIKELESLSMDKSVDFRINGHFSGLLLRFEGYDHAYLDLN